MRCSSSTRPGFRPGAGVQTLTLAPTRGQRSRLPGWLLLATCAVAPAGLWGCAPGGGGVAPGGARGYWAPETTKSPPLVDAMPGGPDDPEPGVPDPTPLPPGGPAPTLDAGSTPAKDAPAALDARPPLGPDAATTSPPSPDPAGPPAVAGPCRFKFDVTTTNAGGQYAPRNSGVIWVSDGTNRFVKTLRVWANRRQKHLDKWITASGQDTTDAVTGATLTTHGVRSVTWDCSDVKKQPVPFGEYRINVEFTEKNSAGPSISFPFPRNGAPLMMTAPDQGNFKGARIEVMP
jgi:hypothetical protein